MLRTLLVSSLLTLPSVISDNKLCQLQSQNISLVSKDEIPFYMAEQTSSKTRIYVSPCHTLGDSLPVRDLCDKDAYACITKINEGTQPKYLETVIILIM